MELHEKVIVGCGNFGGIGSDPKFYGKGDPVEAALETLDHARELGLYRFDTANSYGGGVSEEVLGNWLSRQDPVFRQKVQISTKVGNPYGARAGHAPMSAAEIHFQLERSLKRLRVDCIDTYYLHEFPADSELKDALNALENALREGQIFSFGLSDVSLENIRRFLRLAGAPLSRSFSHVQNEFHFLKTSDQQELIPFLQEHGVKYSAFSPLAGGLLTGKYRFQASPPEGSRLSLRGEPYEQYLDQKNFKKIGSFIDEAKSRNLHPAQAALQFVLGTPGIDSAVIGPRARRHYEDLGFK